MNKISQQLLVVISVLGAILISGCSSLIDKHVEWETVEPEEYPVLNAIGYAPITLQRGNTDNDRTLMAMRASKLDAYRELAEQVYGQKLDGSQSVANLVLQDSRLKASVEGVIRGARVVKSYPVGEDTYATELELDMRRVYDIYLSATKPKRIRDVTYY
ncbi:LPP20 family lipoprotein [Alteromonas sp. C1M14]|uniref:LPP20 family lipoprotein n=1 Tax=Alteromonas sp. C1M14 TaxID=2841567 RepID=UPI001C09DCA7|nr:LPP20 family lipoprotein [Alteromonas sp. C1M14]MBU2977914.1 LPP20 family lipoprotein [Alteromonas sp. C1M14]